ncbi:MAG TPA: TIGR03086 family metal-binding protein [Propionibacteriaceae bacterium]
MNRSTTWPVLDTALTALSTVIDGLEEGHLQQPTPCSEWSVAQVIEHAVLDQLIWASQIIGTPGPTGDAFAPTGRLDPTPAAYARRSLSAVPDAWIQTSASTEELATPLPQGPMAPETAATACAMDAAVHAWDIAVATGQPSPLTPELAAAILPVAHQLVEPLRQYGAFAPPWTDDASVDDSGPVSNLLSYLGRNPAWTRSV